jgi:hypothetical protein
MISRQPSRFTMQFALKLLKIVKYNHAGIRHGLGLQNI